MTMTKLNDKSNKLQSGNVKAIKENLKQKKCKICQSHEHILEFKTGYICKSCVDYIKGN